MNRYREDYFFDRLFVNGHYGFKETDGRVRRMSAGACDCTLDFYGGTLVLLIVVECVNKTPEFCVQLYLDWNPASGPCRRLYATKLPLPLDDPFFRREIIMVRSGTFLRFMKDPEEGLLAFQTDIAHALLRGTVVRVRDDTVKSVTVFGEVWENKIMEI